MCFYDWYVINHIISHTPLDIIDKSHLISHSTQEHLNVPKDQVDMTYLLVGHRKRKDMDEKSHLISVTRWIATFFLQKERVKQVYILLPNGRRPFLFGLNPLTQTHHFNNGILEGSHLEISCDNSTIYSETCPIKIQ